MTREEILAMFDRRQEAWQARDPRALAADHAAESTVISPTGGLLKGREAIERVYRLWFSAFPDMDFQREDLLVDEDRAALVWRMTGTHIGEFFGLVATGRRVEVTGVFIYTLEDGRIRHEHRVLDFTGVLIQIGVLKTRA